VSSGDILYRSNRALYWDSLLASHLFGWFLLGFTSWLLPRVWQDKPVLPERKGIFSRLRRQGRGTTAQRAKARQRLLPINPFLWPLIIFALFNLTPLVFIICRAVAGPGHLEALPPI